MITIVPDIHGTIRSISVEPSVIQSEHANAFSEKLQDFRRWLDEHVYADDPQNTVFAERTLKTRADEIDAVSFIDNKISEFSLELYRRGIKPGPGSMMEYILQYYRMKFGAEIVRRRHYNYGYSIAVPDFDAIAEYCLKNGLADYCEETHKPNDYLVTNCTFSTRIIGGRIIRVYSDPLETAKKMQIKQGKTEYIITGDCGIVSCANVAILSGITEMTEERALNIALSCPSIDMDIGNASVNDRGGTHSEGRMLILNKMGISSYLLPCKSNDPETMDKLWKAVADGHGVIVSVDVERLWMNDRKEGHAFMLLSVSEDGQTFFAMDTGLGKMIEISRERLSYALSGRPANVTEKIIR